MNKWWMLTCVSFLFSLIVIMDISSKNPSNAMNMQVTPTAFPHSEFDLITAENGQFLEAIYNNTLNGEIHSVAWSPDDRYLAVGGNAEGYGKGFALLYDITDFSHEPVTLSEKTTVVLKFDPSGHYLVAGGGMEITIWETENFSEVVSIETPNQIQNLDISPDGRKIASVDLGFYVRVWDIQTGELLKSLQYFGGVRGGGTAIYDVAFSPTDSVLIFSDGIGGSENPLLYSWGYESDNLPTPFEVIEVADISNTVTCIEFDLEGELLATGGWDGTIKLWDIQTLSFKTGLTITDGWIAAIDFDPSNNILASSDVNGTLSIWDMKHYSNIISIQDDQLIWSVAFNHEGTLIASGGTLGKLTIWGIPR
ncbi:MAG: hypothetical protein K8L91_14350 [Anaerolineae bacterium]|nr:hypothetical protein [Anaerolineae bacterium]